MFAVVSALGQSIGLLHHRQKSKLKPNVSGNVPVGSSPVSWALPKLIGWGECDQVWQ